MLIHGTVKIQQKRMEWNSVSTEKRNCDGVTCEKLCKLTLKKCKRIQKMKIW